MTRQDDLPAALPSLWLSVRLGFRAEPRLLPLTFAMTSVALLPDVLILLTLRLLSDSIVAGDRHGILVAGVLVPALTVAIWLFSVVSGRLTETFGSRVTVWLEAHVAGLQAAAPGLVHHENADYLDRLSILRNQVFALKHLYRSIFATAAAAIRVVVAILLLASVNPLIVVLGLFALLPVLLSGRAAERVRATKERVAGEERLARHTFVIGTSPATGKEVRVAGISEVLVDQHDAARARWYGPMAARRLSGATLQASAWALFSAAYVAALVLETKVFHASAGAVVVVLAAGGRLSQYLGELVSEANFLRGDWLGAARTMAWLERYAGSGATGSAEPPRRLRTGIRLEGVTFRYPGAQKDSLRDVDIFLPAGSVVAVVGENGAGKTTLVKLLCRFYEPTSGLITVDGVDLATLDVRRWRDRITGVFQDFFAFEWIAKRSIALGDLPRIEDADAAESALRRTGGQELLQRLPQGLETQLGGSWPGGVELSTGQWQRIAVARGAMRGTTLLRVLDEPSSAVDAQAEHALFESYSAMAEGDSSAVTLLVSHRFSTVRMADLIVVLDGSSVVECGTHTDLMARNGKYADLYTIQASSYR